MGVDGVGGIALSFRQGTYVRGSAKLSPKFVSIGELYRREIVPTEVRLIVFESAGFVEIVVIGSEFLGGKACSLPRISLLLHSDT